MATNKHATIRYHALDKCFSNYGRRYFIEDLIDACSKAIEDYTGKAEGVKRRQIFDDMLFMESEQGWSVPLVRLKEGRRVYYRYADIDYSIRNQPINETEAGQLQETLLMLSRFKGMPQFEWVEDMLVRMESSFNLLARDKPIVGFEQNPYLRGLNHFSDLFNAIQNRKVLELKYRGYKQVLAVDLIIHPYYLKQYNSRWFLFGYNDQQKAISNLALDRIIGFKELRKKFRKNLDVDFDEYFEDIVGVTIPNDAHPEKVVIKVTRDQWPYVESKPIHGSQKVKSDDIEGVTIELNVIVNYELISLLFSFGESIRIISPEHLKSTLELKAKALLSAYS